jgi:hypothetical protein
MRSFCLALILLLVGPLAAQEKVTFTSAVYVDPGAAEFRVSSLYLNVSGSEIRAVLTEVNAGTTTFKDGGKVLLCTYGGAAADSLLVTLNKMNFSTTSLQKRIMQQCQTDGKLGAGTISGTPQ